MRRNPATVVILAGPVADEVLARVGRSMNVTLARPAEPAGSDGDTMALAAAALRQAARAMSPYALVAADPLAAVADGWRSMWDVSRPQGPAGFEQEAGSCCRPGGQACSSCRTTTWSPPRALAVASLVTPASRGRTFISGRCVRSGRTGVAFVAAAEPAQQAAGILHTLGSLQPGRWWPGLDEVIETARGFYPGRLAEAAGR